MPIWQGSPPFLPTEHWGEARLPETDDSNFSYSLISNEQITAISSPSDKEIVLGIKNFKKKGRSQMIVFKNCFLI
jgi:hypothetical protein